MSGSEDLVPIPSGRIGYIDAMRGFTMLLVVFSHVLVKCFSGNPDFSFNSIFVTFRMPLFFFLSGFLCYKPNRFTSPSIASFLWSKFKVQIIPTIIFAGLFCYLWHISFRLLLLDDSKTGYWFTYILFYYYLLFSCLFYFFSRIKLFQDERIVVKLVFLASFCVTFLSYFLQTSYCTFSSWNGLRILSSSKFCYFSFFCFGSLVKAFFSKFQELLDNGKVMAGILILEVVFLLLKHSSLTSIGTLSILFNIILGFLGITIVFAFFRKYRNSFENSGTIGRSLQYIGVRTLDIYLIHYFILPRNLSLVGNFFESFNNPVLELFLGLLVASLVIVVCLVISSVIRLSASMAKGLFGKVIV